jgi:hypothetical protein
VTVCVHGRVATVSIPQRCGSKTLQTPDHERSAAFKQGQRFRARIEGRISVLMRGRGLKRCRAEGAKRFAVFVGAAVLANKLMIIAALLMKERSRRRKATRKPCSRCRARNQLRLRLPVRPKMARKRKFSRDRHLRRDMGIPRSTTSTRSMIAIRISARDASGLTSITPYWRYRSTAMAVTGRAERSRCDRRVPNRARVRWRPEWRR